MKKINRTRKRIRSDKRK